MILSDLVVLEQFKSSIPEIIAVYISEQEAKKEAAAAALADDYVLMHRSVSKTIVQNWSYDGEGAVPMQDDDFGVEIPVLFVLMFFCCF